MSFDLAALEPFIVPIFVPVLIAFIGSNALTAVLTQFLNRRQNKLTNKNLEIDGDVKISDTAIKIADGLRKDIERSTNALSDARKEQKELRKVISAQAKRIMKLELQMDDVEDENKSLKKENSKLKTESIEVRAELEHQKFLQISNNQ